MGMMGLCKHLYYIWNWGENLSHTTKLHRVYRGLNKVCSSQRLRPLFSRVEGHGESAARWGSVLRAGFWLRPPTPRGEAQRMKPTTNQNRGMAVRMCGNRSTQLPLAPSYLMRLCKFPHYCRGRIFSTSMKIFCKMFLYGEFLETAISTYVFSLCLPHTESQHFFLSLGVRNVSVECVCLSPGAGQVLVPALPGRG